MTAIAAITISDGKGVPVVHTFNPLSSGQRSSYRESIASLALAGQGTVDITATPDNKNGLTKVVLALALPSLEVVTGQNAQGYSAAPKVAYTDKVVMTFFRPTRSTAANGKDLRTLAINLLANAQVVDAIENLAAPY